MDWIEIIHLRSHTHQDRVNAVDAFHHLLMPGQAPLQVSVSLFQHQRLRNDLSIIIHWQNGRTKMDKSPLGMQLAAAFSEFGQINHSVWSRTASLFAQQRRAINDIYAF